MGGLNDKSLMQHTALIKVLLPASIPMNSGCNRNMPMNRGVDQRLIPSFSSLIADLKILTVLE